MFTNETGEKNHAAKHLRDKLHRQLDLASNSTLPLTNCTTLVLAIVPQLNIKMDENDPLKNQNRHDPKKIYKWPTMLEKGLTITPQQGNTKQTDTNVRIYQ